MEEVQQVKQKNNFHNLCLLLSERFKFTNKQAEKKAHEIIQRGINQFEIENQNIRLNGKERKSLIDELYSLVISKLNGDVDSFEDLQIYIYTKDFEKMTASVIGSIQSKKELETIPPTKTESSKRSEAQKRADKKYQSSAKGRASYNQYIKSIKGIESLKKYRQSEKGKLTIGKAVKKYQKTVNGYEAIKRAVKKYSQTERGKELRREAVRRFRERQKQKQLISTVVD